MERPGTDHVISVPMRGLDKNCTCKQTDTHTDRHGDYMTEFSEKALIENIGFENTVGIISTICEVEWSG